MRPAKKRVQQKKMSDQKEAIHNLNTRASVAVAHMGDVNSLAQQRDALRALTLVAALNGDENVIKGVKDALRHAENALLVKLLATGTVGELDAAHYTTALCVFTIMELNGDQEEHEYFYEDVWALNVLIIQHYEPVPYAPYTREQLIQAMQEEEK